MIHQNLDRTKITWPRLCSGRLPRRALFALCSTCALLTSTFLPISFAAAAQTPDWCKPLPRPEYKSLERIKISVPWFEVYKAAPNTLAIYEPHQSEETIGYLILGQNKAVLFDTGMGISDLRATVQQLTKLPIIVLNSHTHDDHVGDNHWRGVQ